ncbi:sensor histidine kinase [Paenibacillus sp. J5C_2022]|uniref:sensor histidine kinase n=1 Tax=Paenibacillus sp. J5C2022 TaxID=2977129 RepID=UPI0021CF7AFC|nr:sensor histidine kinase [Paenibacillus sp. J5C2022]MCU6712096.1 sensor histidine kinase [Paenibacillus sp. J5C2022]
MNRFDSIHGRLFPIFLLSMLGLLLVVTVVYYNRATDQIREKVSAMAEKNISQTVGLFDLMLQGYDSVTRALNSNNELVRMLQQYGGAEPVEAVQLEKRITDVIGAVYYSRKDIVGIHILTNKDKVFSFEKSFGASVRDYARTAWFAELKASTGEMKWLGVFPESLLSEGINQPVFAFGRQLFDLDTLKTIGVVLIETDAEAMLSALSNASLGPGSEVIIRDAAGTDMLSTLSASNASLELAGNWPEAELVGNRIIVRETADAMMTAARIGLADWTMIGITPNRELQLELKETQQFLLTLSLLLIVASTVLATLVSRSFSSPFKRLIGQMKRVELGNFKGEVQVRSYYEINVLVGSFNRMVRQMDELIERTKLASISEKNAQLQALQAQVNPHFLFNTLDMIYWMLDERENDRLGRVILALSSMFRYSSDWEDASRAKLCNELEQFRHYFAIIETRMAGRIRTSIEVEERWLDLEVPKMILQPIVENAVKYGLEPSKRQQREGRLRVYSRQAAGKLEIVVEDDGVGMEEETLHRLRDALEDMQEPGAASEEPRLRRGIGLLNVHRRIRLMYGNGYGLHITSVCGQGTAVAASFPMPGGEGGGWNEHSCGR